jgi:O-acetyl-ADP-ribose deacetylase
MKFSIDVPLRSGGTASLQCRHGDMTEEDVDVIVNAANQSLDHASGLAGAIVKKGGRIIQDESDTHYHRVGKIDVGSLHVTTAGRLKAKHVFHAVGPIWRGGREGEEMLLEVCVRTVLDRMEEMNLASVSLPAISSGIFNFPKKRCAEIMIDMALTHFRETEKSSIREVRLCNFDDETVGIFEKELRAAAAKLPSSGAGASESSDAGAGKGTGAASTQAASTNPFAAGNDDDDAPPPFRDSDDDDDDDDDGPPRAVAQSDDGKPPPFSEDSDGSDDGPERAVAEDSSSDSDGPERAVAMKDNNNSDGEDDGPNLIDFP